MWNVGIIDGHGRKNRAKINGEGELSVVVHPHPPLDEEVSALPYAQFFTQDGDGSTIAMNVNASTTNLSFEVNAVFDFDIYVKTITVLLADSGAAISEFGAIAGGLTNGLELTWRSADIGEIVIDNAIKTNFDFYRLASGKLAVEIYPNISGNNEGVIPIIDLAATFGLPYGIRLRKGTKDKLQFIAKDNLSTITTFNIKAFGIKL